MPDVNVLVYAHRAQEATHAEYAQWLQETLNGPEPLGLSVLVAAGFLRIATDLRIYREPTPLALAIAFIEEIAAHSRCRLVIPGPTHLDDVLRLCRATGTVGGAISDAQHAALAIAEGATWVTRDEDFGRFEAHGLRWQHLVPN